MRSPSNKAIVPLLLLGVGLLTLGVKAAIKAFAPVSGGKVSSPFGERINPLTNQKEFHNGVDIAVPDGTNVLSVGAGTVTNVYTTDAGGLQIVIKNDSGITTGFAHLQKSFVSIGDRVNKNQKIALSGSSGQVTGAHLHFSVRDKSGKYVNPEFTFPIA